MPAADTASRESDAYVGRYGDTVEGELGSMAEDIAAVDAGDADGVLAAGVGKIAGGAVEGTAAAGGAVGHAGVGIVAGEGNAGSVVDDGAADAAG